ncbi:MAG TPA: ABC-F family ATP-binding cassette domain-containing protein [Dinghuibacter sp.]|uniref:ABC-F family ATP-binding cassette domain-containing protein n=1 Tax=Dinghuibacter sp. TaxID=2024697 RepID=UPI002B892653|nr:ABC-F family ATP-binding cassette domain-containing protein [Dinghuibacter sp.]HTJ12467.1 ABC-F family ATP-binding cassette domain-containing protein [Dinghuibacter sp.]
MHYASVDNIAKSYGARTLFQSISFHVEEGDKIALIARNGSGKSTLLNIIAGRDTPDSGSVWVHKDVKVVLLPQESDYNPTLNVWDNLLSLDHPVVRAVKAYEQYLEETGDQGDARLGDLLQELDRLEAWQFEAQVKQILGKLNLHHLKAPMRQLSGGQRKRVALAQALLESQLHGPATLLLLDEPTNHLDVNMIEWLQEYLSAARATVVLVTHDRYFLDAVCSEIIELDTSVAHVYHGDYDNFLVTKAARQESDAATGAKTQNLYRKELEWMRKQPKARTTKSRSREDNFHALEEKVRQRTEHSELTLQAKMTRLGGKIMEMKKVYKAYGSHVILKGFDYTFKRGERIGVVGPNGVGKSTFLRMLLGLEEADSGKMNPGETVVFGHFSQDGLEWKEDMRVIEYVKTMAEFFPLADGSKISAAQFLQLFAFPPEQQYTYLSKLSGGEKRRLQLLTILFRNPNFLVLDEPTNDLDLQTLRILEDFLSDFGGCLVIVSHDRYFMDRVVDHLFVFEGEGRVRDFPGNYTQYREAQRQEEKAVPVAPVAPTPAIAPPATPKAVKLTFKEKREFEQLEQELPALESEKRALEEKMSSGALDYDTLTQAGARIQEIVALLEEKEMRWLELSERS